MSRAPTRRRPRGRGGRRSGPAPLSTEARERRAALVPSVSYPDELPITAWVDEIADLLRDRQVVVVAGETGSGKTTQLPKICLALGRGIGGMIGHTQPRRIAARGVSERIAEELGVELGRQVGYQVRFTDHSGPDTLVKVMTDGILLSELQHDRLLQKYDTLIIDEAHERSLNIDFILGYLRRLLPRRPDLKVVITSATIDVERFSEHFADDRGPAPIVEVSGRTYPVEVRYRPLVEERDTDDEGEVLVRDLTEAIIDGVRELQAEGPGDILVFLPGEREIRDTAEALSKVAATGGPSSFEILPLYSRLSAREQHRVFEPHSGRRVVLATNVAETSLTVPGIRYVIDSGLARVSRFSYRTKVQRLPVEPISQASARQRSGRCGRLEAGVAIRLFGEEDFEGRPEFTDPEILRTNLASVLLQMAALGLGDLARFPFLDPPDRRHVSAGVQLLEELGAFGPAEKGRPRRLTRLGRRLAAIPVDPRVGRMILEADRRGVLREVLVIAAALSSQDPRERPVDQEARADQLHARFRHPGSDFLTLLNLWFYVRGQQRELSSSAFRRLCRDEHLNYLRIREWQDLESQLRQIAKQLRLDLGKAPRSMDEVDEEAVHRSLLTGLLSHVGLRDPERRDYLGARGARFAIFPGSGLFRKQPALVMAAELVETSRLYARTNAEVRPDWVEKAAEHLVKRSYSEPHWSKKRGSVVAVEKVSLYGIPIVGDRTVSYGSIDPELSRELFIRHALVYGEWETRHRFLTKNQRLLEEAEELEHRARRRGIVVDEHTLFDFYDERVPRSVVSGAHFDAWWKKERQRHGHLLDFDPSMLVREEAATETERDFPTHWQEGPLTFSLAYHFEPGAPDDGVTVELPVETLNQVDDEAFSWLVPGLREELVVALIRSLPKSLRVNFVPAPNYATAFLEAVSPGEEPLLDALERYLRGATGVHVPREAWDWTRVPAHLRPTFRVLDAEGAAVGVGKDLAALKAPLEEEFDQALTSVAADRTASGETEWTFGAIEREFVQARAGHEVRGFPALVDEGSTVGLQVFGSVEEQAAHHRLGLRRLLALTLPDATRELGEGLSTEAKLTLVAAPYASLADTLADCRLAAIGALADREGGDVWDQDSFARLRDAVAAGLDDEVRSVAADAQRALTVWRDVDRGLSGSVDLAMLPAVTDMRLQVDRLVHDGFIAEAGAERLRALPRYLKAVALRRSKLDESVARDRTQMDRIAALQEAYLNRIAALPDGRTPTLELERVRWLLEEYRVSLWAQQLGTGESVSDARIRKALAAT